MSFARHGALWLVLIGFLGLMVVAGEIDPPVMVKLPGLASLFGTRMSIRRSPVWSGGEPVNPKLLVVDVGVFVPLSMQVDTDPVPHHPWSVADAGPASTARVIALANTPRSVAFTVQVPPITIYLSHFPMEGFFTLRSLNARVMQGVQETDQRSDSGKFGELGLKPYYRYADL